MRRRLHRWCPHHRSGDEDGGPGSLARPRSEQRDTFLLRPGVEVLKRGVTFGLLTTDYPVGPWLLILLTSAVTLGLLVWLARVKSRSQAAIGLVTSGALGNLVERLRHGAVTDFLSFHFQGHHWPAFNLADTGIVLGVLLLLVGDLLAPAGRRQTTDGEGLALLDLRGARRHGRLL